jgi:hypothetical protein
MTTTFEVDQGTSARYSATLVDENSDPISGADLFSLVLTLTAADGSYINSRNSQNVLNANGVTVDDSGVLVWDLAPADNPIVSSIGLGGVEEHDALFEFTWSGGAKAAKHRISLLVTKLK